MIAEDMGAFFNTADLAVSATIVTGTSTATAAVFCDTPSQSVLGGNVLVDDTSIVAPSSVSLARGSTVTVNGGNYTVLSVEKLDDGALQRALLVTA